MAVAAPVARLTVNRRAPVPGLPPSIPYIVVPFHASPEIEFASPVGPTATEAPVVGLRVRSVFETTVVPYSVDPTYARPEKASPSATGAPIAAPVVRLNWLMWKP